MQLLTDLTEKWSSWKHRCTYVWMRTIYLSASVMLTGTQLLRNQKRVLQVLSLKSKSFWKLTELLQYRNRAEREQRNYFFHPPRFYKDIYHRIAWNKFQINLKELEEYPKSLYLSNSAQKVEFIIHRFITQRYI